MKKLFALIMILMMLSAFTDISMSRTVYIKDTRTGGGATSLDGIDGALLADKDAATVYLSGIEYIYVLNATSGATDNGTSIIAPDTNAGTKRWILQSAGGGGATIDDTKGNGDTAYVWSADKVFDQLALKLSLAGGTLTGNLLFSTDNTLDIGASGATRPRTIYAGTSIITPALTITGASGLTLSKQSGVAGTGLMFDDYSTEAFGDGWMGSHQTGALGANRYYQFPTAANTAGQIMVFGAPAGGVSIATWANPSSGGGGVTGSTTPTSGDAAEWNASLNLAANQFIAGVNKAAASGGTVTMTIASPYTQIRTGSSNETDVLPVASTLPNGWGQMYINSSTGIITVQTSGSNVILAVPAGGSLWVSVQDSTAGTGLASWTYAYNSIFAGSDGQYRIVITNNSAISPTASADELYPEAHVWKVNQNGTESSVAIGPTAGQISFTGPTQARIVTLPDAAVTIPANPMGGTLGATTNIIPKANGTGTATLQASGITEDGTNVGLGALNLVTTGTIQGGIKISSDADGMSESEMTAVGLYGSLFMATGAGTWTLPTAVAGMSACLMDSGTAHDLILDVQAGDDVQLSGTEQANRVGITNASGSSTGDFVCVVAISAGHWVTLGKSGTWASQ